MMNTQTARMLAQYKARADKLMFESVAALPPGEAEKERRTLFKSIIGTLNHTYVVDMIWQAHLEGRALSVPLRGAAGLAPRAYLKESVHRSSPAGHGRRDRRREEAHGDGS
jgi:uncharacterized damage-inducible protein DinB